MAKAKETALEDLPLATLNSLLTTQMVTTRLSKDFIIPKISLYEGHTDPTKHLENYEGLGASPTMQSVIFFPTS